MKQHWVSLEDVGAVAATVLLDPAKYKAKTIVSSLSSRLFLPAPPLSLHRELLAVLRVGGSKEQHERSGGGDIERE
eukprot:3007040-Rhodomonas_salina.1